jgi:hypothetical protein
VNASLTVLCDSIVHTLIFGATSQNDFLGNESCIVTGIDVPSSFNGLILSPNPATNQIRIESNNFKLQSIHIYNVTGQLQTTHFKPQTNSIDISELTPGIYFVTLKDEAGNKAVRKVVKM